MAITLERVPLAVWVRSDLDTIGKKRDEPIEYLSSKHSRLLFYIKLAGSFAWNFGNSFFPNIKFSSLLLIEIHEILHLSMTAGLKWKTGK